MYMYNKSISNIQQPQRSQSSPARPSSTVIDDSKRQTNETKSISFVYLNIFIYYYLFRKI